MIAGAAEAAVAGGIATLGRIDVFDGMPILDLKSVGDRRMPEDKAK